MNTKKMKLKSILVVGLLFTFLAVDAQEWHMDLNEAKKVATDKGQKIILVFQGSDWCGPCIKLDKEIWSTDTFKNYAKDHFVMLKADFPKRKKNKLVSEQQEKNNKLAEMYNKQGFFPHVVVLNNQGKVLGREGYEKISPEEYIKKLNAY